MIKPNPCSVLSLDIGKKRIGIAGCDPLGIAITHLPAVFRKSLKEDLRQFELICLDRRIKGLIIGNPLDMNGKETKQSLQCIKYGKELAKDLQLPFIFINEYGTTIAASEKFSLKKDRTGRIDSASAAILLQQWLIEGPDFSASI